MEQKPSDPTGSDKDKKDIIDEIEKTGLVALVYLAPHALLFINAYLADSKDGMTLSMGAGMLTILIAILELSRAHEKREAERAAAEEKNPAKVALNIISESDRESTPETKKPTSRGGITYSIRRVLKGKPEGTDPDTFLNPLKGADDGEDIEEDDTDEVDPGSAAPLKGGWLLNKGKAEDDGVDKVDWDSY